MWAGREADRLVPLTFGSSLSWKCRARAESWWFRCGRLLRGTPQPFSLTKGLLRYYSGRLTGFWFVFKQSSLSETDLYGAGSFVSAD